MGTTHVDIDSGEILRLLPITTDDANPKMKYVYPGGYITMGVLNITRLVKADIPKDGYRLALLIAAKVAPVSNLCHSTNAEFAQELGLSANRISRLIGSLVRARFIFRMAPQLVMVNPGWMFRGSPSEQHSALITWAKLHPIGIVRDEDRKTA